MKMRLKNISESNKGVADRKNDGNTSDDARERNTKSMSCYVMKTPTATAALAPLNDEDMKSLFAAGFSPSVIMYLRKESMRKECNAIILDEIDAEKISKTSATVNRSQQGESMDLADSDEEMENEGNNSVNGGSEGANMNPDMNTSRERSGFNADMANDIINKVLNGRNGNTNDEIENNIGNSGSIGMLPFAGLNFGFPSQNYNGDFEISIQKIIEESKNRAKISKQISAKSILDNLSNRAQPKKVFNALQFNSAQNGRTTEHFNHIDTVVDSSGK